MANTKVDEELEIIDLDKEENTEKKGFIKNLKTNKKLLIGIGTIGACVLVGTLVGTILFPKKEKTNTTPVKTTLEDTLKRNNENTLLDEIIYFDGNIGDKINDINSNLEVEELNPNYNIDLLLCINQLERYINLNSKIKNLNYENKNEINEVDEATKEELFNNKNNIEYVENLINKFNDKNTTDIEKARTYQKLTYLNKYYETYVTNNGLTIVENLLKKVLKGLACEASGLEVDYYDNCKISANENIIREYITVTDPVSGAEYIYKIGPRSKIVNTILNDLYKIQELKKIKKEKDNDDDKDNNITYEEIATNCINKLNNTKKLLETEIELKNYLFVPVEVKTKTKTKTKGQ